MNLEKTITNTVGKSITAICIGAGIAAAGYMMYKAAVITQNNIAYDMYNMFYAR